MAVSKKGLLWYALCVRVAAWSAPLVLAATPPALLNYQGVLRDQTDKPLTGTYDMTFRFLDAATGGNEILVDQHAAAQGSAITVSGGLFNTALGGGTVTDGTGAGTYLSLDAVFRDYGAVWLEVKVGAEVLSPRTPIQSSAYALNAANAASAVSAASAATATNATALNGQTSDFYLDGSATRQSKYGTLHLEASAAGFATLDAIASYPAPYAIYAQDGYSRCGIGVDAASGFDYGIDCAGLSIGAYFHDDAHFDYAYVADNGLGISAAGSIAGGVFNQFGNGYANVAYNGYKIQGTGSVSFVQNHPADPSKVIVYAAPEGDEVAVYTRGSARLVDGEARVALGETFPLVANPDIGLTAVATPKGDPIALAVVDASTRTLVVRGPAGSNAEFDYMVWGLRIGFETQSIVQPKARDSRIPSMAAHERFFAEDPSLRRTTALARFEGIEAAVHGRAHVDLGRAAELRGAIGVFPDPAAAEPETPFLPHDPAPSSLHAAQPPRGDAADTLPEEPASGAGFLGPARPPEPDRLPALGAIELGDLLSLSTTAPGSVVRSSGVGDPLVIGCAQVEAGRPASGGTIPIATSHIALCRVDADLGAIAVGDRLMASPIAGAAMKADPSSATSVVIGRAVEPLPSGSALILVLLGAR